MSHTPTKGPASATAKNYTVSGQLTKMNIFCSLNLSLSVFLVKYKVLKECETQKILL